MKPLDNENNDFLTKKLNGQQEQLLTLLREAYHVHPTLSQEEHEGALVRVRRQFLLRAEQSFSLYEEASFPPVEGTTSACKPALMRLQPRRGRGFMQALNALAAVLVVGVLIGGSFLFFTRLAPRLHSQPAQTTVKEENMVTVVSSAGGLEMSMSVTDGPYFLGEMLAVDISLTNHTQTLDYVGPPFAKDVCGYWPGVEVTGGSAPEYPIPIPTDHRCPMFGTPLLLRPGQTLTTHKYLPLTKSGNQTLTASIVFNIGSTIGGTQKSDPSPFSSQASNPLEKHWPTLHVSVNPTTPPERMLSIDMQGLRITINAPTGKPSHLAYLYDTECNDANNGNITIIGNYGWELIATNSVTVPNCPGIRESWHLAFGVPDYAVVVVSNGPPIA